MSMGTDTRTPKPSSAVRTMDGCWSRTDFAVELAIYESGIPPEYRVWLYEDDKLAAARVAATVEVEIAAAGRTSASVSRFVRKANTCGEAAWSPSRIRSM